MERPFRILLVEDNPDDVEITRWALARALPCEIEVIGDGDTAIARLTSASEGAGGTLQSAEYADPHDATAARSLPDLILLDLGLPMKNGLEVLRCIRNHRPLERTPVMVLTSESDDDRVISDAYAWGTNSYFVKPATRAGFAEALRVLALGVIRKASPTPGDSDPMPSVDG